MKFIHEQNRIYGTDENGRAAAYMRIYEIDEEPHVHMEQWR